MSYCRGNEVSNPSCHEVSNTFPLLMTIFYYTNSSTPHTYPPGTNYKISSCLNIEK